MGDMIDTMIIRGVQLELGQGTFSVVADDLAYYADIPIERIQSLSERDFFFLACDYLEATDDDVVNTDQAKIDIWYSGRSGR